MPSTALIREPSDPAPAHQADLGLSASIGFALNTHATAKPRGLGKPSTTNEPLHVLAAADEMLVRLARVHLAGSGRIQGQPALQHCVRLLLAGAPPGALLVLYFDDAQRFVAAERRSRVDGSCPASDAGSIAAQGIRYGARSVLTAHRWTAGRLLAFHADVMKALELGSALTTTGIDLFDHLLVLGGETVSCRQLGLLSP